MSPLTHILALLAVTNKLQFTKMAFNHKHNIALLVLDYSNHSNS